VPIRKRILVIDDDQALREVIVAALESEHDVVALESAVEALGHLDKSQNSYDWVICDLMMPAMTGMEFYEIIRARGMGFEKKIILITGGAFTPKIRGWMETLTNPKLEKPFRMKQLKELLNQSR
jgi:CheY-like chemotaxis protein